ncbi:RHS repeat-associated core domain-containing protein [Methylomonas sp. MgM2]
MSNTEGLLGETYPVFQTSGANNALLEFYLYYASYNANGDPSLDTVTGFGWSHSYNIFLFTQGRDVFKMSPAGIVTKYQRLGRRGSLSALPGTQQEIVENPDGSIVITNRQGGTAFLFRKIPGNPLRVAAVEPLMLTSITDRNGNVTQLTYQNGLLSLVEDAFGRQIKLDYNASHHLTKITDPLGRVTQLQYGGYSNLTKIIDPLGNTVQYAYDVRHQIIRKVDKDGHQWTYKYNAGGHPIAVTDQAGDPVLSLANPDDWATNATDLALYKLRTYIPSVTTHTDGRGNQWQYSYNSDGQITKIVAPDGAATTYAYDPATLNMASMTDANGHTTQYEYDGFGNLIKQTDANGNEIRYEYNNPFNFVTHMAYFGNGANTPHSVTTYEYDALGNRIRETRDVGGLNLRTDWGYYVSGVPEPGNPSGVRGLMKSEEVHNGSIVQITSYQYDDFGNRNKVTDPEGNVTVYGYDMLGNRLTLIDANGHEWGYTYDALDRLIRETDPLDFLTEYDYDGVGNRTEVRKQATKTPDIFQITRYEYDLRNRLIKEIRDPDDLNLVTAYSYDNNDNRKTVTDPRNKITSFDYDQQNRLSKVTDALGNQTQYAYDPVGNRIQETDANGHKSCNQYDALNRLTVQIRKMGATSCALTAANDIVTQHFYDSGAAMACDHDPGSPTCDGPTPGSSNIAYTIDPEGKYSYFKYDKVDRRWITIRKVTDNADSCDGDDWCEYTKYDDASNVTARIDANGNRTDYGYFLNNWLHSEIVDPGGLNLTTTTVYDGVGNAKTVTNPRGNVATNSYDARNQLVLVTDSIGKVADYQYDGIGNRTQECDGNTNCTGYVYDAVNRLVAVTDAMGNNTTNGYDKAGNLIKVTDRESHVSCHYYDDINRRTRTAQLMGGSNCALLSFKDLWTDTEYDAVGNVTRLITAKQNSTPAACAGASPPADCETTSYRYDPADRLVLETYADSTTRQFEYDKAGNLIQRTDQLGQVTQYAYNDLYYPVLRDYLDPTEPDDSFTYDVGGRMLSADRNGWVTNFDSYDAANRLLQTTQDAAGTPMVVQYVYDTPAGKRDVTYPGGRACNEQMDLRGRLQDDSCDSFNASYLYDLGNRVETRTYNNGVTASYGYNANNWITSLTHSGNVAGFNYEYDKEGNKQYEDKQHDQTKSEAYAYDDVYRLIDYKVGELVGSTVLVPTTQHEYDLDKVGNWDQFKINGVAFKNTPNQMNEYDDPSTDGPGEIPDDLGIPNNFKDLVATPAPDGENWAHDKNGNRREDGKRLYVYDDENRLIQVTRKSDNVVSEYRYDALSRRVVKTVGVGSPSPVTTRYAYDDARIVEEQDLTAATLATYVYGNYIDEVLNMQRGGADYYYHQNALWSVAAVTNAAGVVVERYDYSDYGCPSATHSAIGNPWMFTGRQWDEESGLYFYRARYYDCESGRFLQRDPLGYVDGMNLYGYVANKPSTLLDPFGYWTWTALEDCTIKFKTYMIIYGNFANWKLALDITKQIKNFWNVNTPKYFCCEVQFDVFIAPIKSKPVASKSAPNFDLIKILGGRGGSSSTMGTPNKIAANEGSWFYNEKEEFSYEHEFGHLLGLDDEYNYSGPGGSLVNLNPQGVGNPQSIMAETWRSKGIAPRVLQTHIDELVKKSKIKEDKCRRSGVGDCCPMCLNRTGFAAPS